MARSAKIGLASIVGPSQPERAAGFYIRVFFDKAAEQ